MTETIISFSRQRAMKSDLTKRRCPGILYVIRDTQAPSEYTDPVLP